MPRDALVYLFVLFGGTPSDVAKYTDQSHTMIGAQAIVVVTRVEVPLVPIVS